jgi:UDP-N-acetylmuramyl pentapeptide phosphotransferase/UDP-N-acetylglucosamine-1-phosphate transferase
VNFYNFMDGIDGLAGVQAVVTGLGLAAAGLDPWVTLVGLALAAASAGFLLFNWSPATIFLGDAGSGVLGYAFAALPLLAPPGLREAGVRLAALSLAFFVGDALFTLCRRVARGERFYEAHREHLYQRLVISGLSHARVSLTLGLGAAVLTVAAVSALGSGTVAVAWTVTLLALLLISLEIGWVAARERESLR